MATVGTALAGIAAVTDALFPNRTSLLTNADDVLFLFRFAVDDVSPRIRAVGMGNDVRNEADDDDDVATSKRAPL